MVVFDRIQSRFHSFMLSHCSTAYTTTTSLFSQAFKGGRCSNSITINWNEWAGFPSYFVARGQRQREKTLFSTANRPAMPSDNTLVERTPNQATGAQKGVIYLSICRLSKCRVCVQNTWGNVTTRKFPTSCNWCYEITKSNSDANLVLGVLHMSHLINCYLFSGGSANTWHRNEICGCK